MGATDEPANAREYQARRISAQAKPHENVEVERRRKDLLALAKTPEGKRILLWLITKERSKPFQGNSRDGYDMGRRHIGDEMEEMIKGILPRELFIELMYPKKEE